MEQTIILTILTILSIVTISLVQAKNELQKEGKI